MFSTFREGGKDPPRPLDPMAFSRGWLLFKVEMRLKAKIRALFF